MKFGFTKFFLIISSIVLFIFFPRFVSAARLLSSGLELNSATNGVDLSVANGPTVQASIVRSGTYAGAVQSVSGLAVNFRTLTFYQTATVLYMRVYFYFETLPGAGTENRIMATFNNASPFAQTAWITLDSAGVLRLYDNGTQISGTDTVGANTWYRIELHWDATTGASGVDVLEARLDGTIFSSATDRTLSTTNQGVAFGANIIAASATELNTGTWYIDDVAVNDNTGSNQTSWPGEGRIFNYKPNVAGDNSMGSNGGTDCGATWCQVDETTPNDATDYYILDVVDDILDVGLEDTNLASKSFHAYSTVSVIHVNSRTNDSGVGARICALRVKSRGDGTVVASSNFSINSAAWISGTDTSANIISIPLTSYTDSQSGGTWNKALIDGSQIGIICSDAAPDVFVSTLWLTVEYVDPPARTNPSLKIKGGSKFRGKIKVMFKPNIVPPVVADLARSAVDRARKMETAIC